MNKYYVNKHKQPNGDHEVHKSGCKYMPSAENQKYLGEFYFCLSAVNEAKKTYPQSNGCYFCSNDCHTS